MRLSVIIPVHNGGDNLRICLEALSNSERIPDELILVNHASTDSSAQTAAAFGAIILSLKEKPGGPAQARNRGASISEGDILVFFDADVVVHPDTLGLIEEYFLDQPEIAALFGSYDDSPFHTSLVSQYKNLLHHFIHQNGNIEASTFWAGAGAIRRDVFHSLGGFNEKYTRPSIEDIELGVRLRNSGYQVRLCPDVLVKHLKRWRFSSLLRSDIFDRAIPWTQLILTTSHLPADLNLDFKSRISACLVWVFLLSICIGCFFNAAWLIAVFAIGVVIVLNFGLYRLFVKRGGVWFGIGAFGLHLLYYLYSSLTFFIFFIWKRVLNFRLA